MKFALIVTALFLYLNSFSQSVPKAILISIDGLRPEFYNDSIYPTPNLQSIAKEGVSAKYMRGVFPSYTYPTHAAMMTGAFPARSKINYNTKENSDEWFWYLRDINKFTIWEIAHKVDLQTAAVQFPVTVGDNITYNIPEIWNPENPADRITATRQYATKGLIEEIEHNATGNLDSINMNEEHLSLDANASKMAAYIFKKYKPSLTAVHFAGVDGAQHNYGREHPKVRKALANVDVAIGHILEAVEQSGLRDSTTIIIVGDHGFSDVHTVIRPNVFLKELGLQEKIKFRAAGGSCFLYGKDEAAVSLLRKVLDTLRLRSSFTVLEKDKLNAMGVDSAAVLALSAKPGYVFSGSISGNLYGVSKGGAHGYDPNSPEMHTGFIAIGRAIREKAVIPSLNVTDIAPLLAKLLGLSFTAPDGKLPEGVLKEK